MKVLVVFRPGGVIRLGKEKRKKRFYPFTTVNLLPQEVCPFCDTQLSDLFCSCEKFKQKFALLQEAKGDPEHSSSLRYGIFGEKVWYSKKISDLSVKSLKTSEIKKLDSDFWDDSAHCVCTGQSYWLKPGTYQDGKVEFYCKNLNTKKVYFCTIAIEFKDEEIALISAEQVLVSGHSRRLGDYHHETKYRKHASFTGWSEFCQALKNV